MQQKLTSSRSREIDRAILAVRLGVFAGAMEYKVKLVGVLQDQTWFINSTQFGYLFSTNAEMLDLLSFCHLWAMLLELGAASAGVAVCSVWVVVVE